MDVYPQGTSVEVLGEFRLPNGDLFDPPDVYCLIKHPDMTETTYHYGVGPAVVRDAEGMYHYWEPPSKPGYFIGRFKGVGDQSVANERKWTITRSGFRAP